MEEPNTNNNETMVTLVSMSTNNNNNNTDDGNEEEEEEIPSRFTLSYDAAILSQLVSDSLGDDEDSGEIEIMRVSSKCLSKVVDFLKHHLDEPMEEIITPLNGNTFEEVKYIQHN